jgi:thiamine monophosphate kinase
MARESRRYGVPIVGGDVARLPGSFVATLALAGEAAGRVLTRTGSRPGDWIYVTGASGGACRPATTTASRRGLPRARGSPGAPRSGR